ncbi:MAG: carboxypeptidase-like regulatory domain-containing protein [Candidatus Woesearchaeota archaeon]
MLKKGEWFGLFLFIIILTSTRYATADLVCGHEPNSALGYGQITIQGVNVTCNNINDSICPEDYQDGESNESVSCASCPDPDCTGTIQGTVRAESGIPVAGAKVTSHPIRWDQNANLERNTTTGYDGAYTFSTPTGTYYISARKDGYDTELKEATITHNGTTSLNFNLVNGTCHADCTNYYGRCNAACDGIVFENGTDSCKFYDATVAQACNNRLKGTRVLLNAYNTTYAYFTDCCEDAPVLRYYAKSVVDTQKIKNLVTVEKIAKYNERPVRLIIAYWEPIDQ